ncbi:MAG: WD40/YVTN/BNR-like repeat-containing protein, partial [Bacteroidota bacterium]
MKIKLILFYCVTATATGQIWQEQYPNQPLSFNDIAFVDTLRGSLIGNNGIIWRTTDGGNTWAPQSSGVQSNLRRIIFQGEIGWIVGDNATVLKTIDGGHRWQQVDSPLQQDFRDVFFLDSHFGWILSSRNLLRTSDGGATWTVLPAPSLARVKFFDAQFGWAHDYGATVYKTTDRGESWSPVLQLMSNFVVNHQIRDLMVTSSDEIVVVGFGYDHHFDWGVRATTKDGGVTWEMSPESYWNYFTNVTRFDHDSVLIFASNGVIFRGEKKLTGNYPSFQKMSFVTPRHWWNTDYSGQVHRTTDGGATWEGQLPGVHYDLKAITFIDRMNGWVAGSGGFTVHTNDGGIT